jgi:hypothetical protein
MTRRSSSNERLRNPDVGRQERHQLDLALDAALLGGDDLDRARSVLLDRLSRHSNDLAATAALQALNRYDAGALVDAQSRTPTRTRDAVRNAGLSAVERIRGGRTDRTP